MGDCQNDGPFLGPHYNTGPNTGPNLGDPKRDHDLDNPPYKDANVVVYTGIMEKKWKRTWKLLYWLI